MMTFSLTFNGAGIIGTLSEYLSFSFVRYAFVVAVLISLCSALLGVTLVLKRYSMIGDGLSHVAFGTGAVSAAVGVMGMAITLPVTVLTAILLLCNKKSKKVMGDAAIAMMSAAALAIGYMILNISGASSSNLGGDVCASLFGSTSILTLSQGDVTLSFVLCAVVLIYYIFGYNRMFSVTFDERFASATGIRVDLYNFGSAVVVAAVIVAGMKLAGALLISALIIFPPMTAMRLFKSYRAVVICSASSSVICSVLGLVIAILFETPVGASIVCVDLVLLAAACVIGYFRKIAYKKNQNGRAL